MQIKYPLVEQTENTGYQCLENPQLRKPYTQKCTKEYLVLLSHCRTVEEAAQQLTGAPGKHGRKVGKATPRCS